jgi:hypothetical protein
MQNLQILSNQPLLATLTLDQDGTIAYGNWSARELCEILNVDGYILSRVQNGYFCPSPRKGKSLIL